MEETITLPLSLFAFAFIFFSFAIPAVVMLMVLLIIRFDKERKRLINKASNSEEFLINECINLNKELLTVNSTKTDFAAYYLEKVNAIVHLAELQGLITNTNNNDLQSNLEDIYIRLQLDNMNVKGHLKEVKKRELILKAKLQDLKKSAQ